MKTWSDLGIQIPFGRTSGKIKTICPECQKGARRNKKDKSLSVNLDEGLYNCHYCGFSGSISSQKEYYNYTKMEKKVYRKPTWRNNTNLSDKLIRYLEEERALSQVTIRKMNISEGMHYIPAKEKECNTIQFPYYLKGELINIKYRTGDKSWAIESGCELILYNIDSTIGQKDVIVTEGEFDCISFVESGYSSVVSVPNGANGTAYLDNYIEEYFDDKETIYIAVDTDTKGILLRDELVRRFGIERCKVVAYGDGCKDANEHLKKYGQRSLRQRIESAEDITIEGVFSLADMRQQVDMLFEKGLQKGLTIGHDHFDNLISFETGRLCVITGIPSHGKSEFVDEIVTRLNIRYEMKFAYFSPENFPLPYLISKLASKFTGKRFGSEFMKRSEYEQVCRHIDDNFFYIYPDEDFTVDTILDRAKYLVKKRGIKGLVIDPYNAIEHQIPAGMSETNYISRLLGKLTTFAREKNVLVFLVAHPKKMEFKNDKPVCPNLYDISGSANFYNKADFGLTVFRDKIADIVQVVIHKVKFKHLGAPGTSNFSYDIDTGRYVPNWGQTNIVFDHTNYLEKKNSQQASLDFKYKSQQELERDFLSPPLTNDEMPF